MKIGFFLFDLNGGGAEKIMVQYMNYLCKFTDDEVFLFLAKKYGPYLSVLDSDVTIIDLHAASSLKSVVPFYRELKRQRVDVLYSTLRNANLISILLGQLLGIRVIIREANTFDVYSKTKKSFVDRMTLSFTKYLYRYAYKCIAISEQVRRDLIKHTNCRSTSISVIYNPIVIHESEFDSVYNLDPGYFHVGLVSRLSAQKNIPTIAKVIEYFLVNHDVHIQFHFFGQGKDSVLLTNLQDRYPNSNVIKLHGFTLDYYSQIKKMSMFIHIPHWEGLGNSVLEVFNSGIPMILSNVESGFSELIFKEDSNVHYVHPTDDVDLIIKTISDYRKGIISVIPNRRQLNLSTSSIYRSYRELAE